MKHQSLSISIPEPCHENWSAMTPAEKGRHCKSCQKTVVDFTRMPKVKIAEFVSQQSGSTCGRFSSDQLNVELIPPKPSKTWMKYAAIILGLVPALGYGQEVIVPEKPIQEMQYPPITEDIEIETKGEIIAHEKPIIQEIQIKGIITDYKTKEILSQASIINYQTNKERKEIEVDKNGRFQASIPVNSAIRVLADGYQSKMLTNSELKTGEDLQIVLKKIEFSQLMGVIAMHPTIKVQKPSKGKIKLHSSVTSKAIEDKQKIQNLPSKVEETGNQELGDNDNKTIPINNESEEPMQYLIPTIEIVAYKVPIIKGNIVGSYATVTEEVKESWFMRLWKKFKSLINQSHEEALISKVKEEESIISSYPNDAIDSNQYQTITDNMDENKPAKNENSSRNNQESLEINVYPNPSSGIFNIDVPSHLDVFFIEVTDINNQLIISKDNVQFDGMIDLSNYNSGSYIISVISEKQLISSKMVVKM